MKKLLGFLAGLFGVVITAGIVLCGCSSKIPRRPSDTNLEFWIAENVKGYDWSGHYEVSGWFGARQFYGAGYGPGKYGEPENSVKYMITAWPDYIDGGQYVTRIDITDPEITVYGLTVNSTFEEFDRVFNKKRGYELGINKNYNSVTHYASNGDFSFSIEDVQGVRSLQISARVTNREGIIF